MKEKTQYCVNHPDVVAAGDCFLCGKTVCYHCTVHAFHKSFCSFHCMMRFVIRALAGGLWKGFKALVTGTGRLVKNLFTPPHKHWVEAILALALIGCLYFFWSIRKELAVIRQMGRMEKDEAADTSRVAPPKIFEPTEGGMVLLNKIDIVGEAEEDRIISLSINGKLEQVTLPKAGRFTFEQIRLHSGENRIDVKAISEKGQVSTLQTILLTYASPSLTYLSRDFRRGSATRKQVALTFDGGAENNAADEILDLLKQENVRSTFFLTGAFIRSFPETVKRIMEEGHEVGNHTWSHPHLTSYGTDRKQRTLETITADRLKRELEKTTELFEMVSGRKITHFWRAPYGELNEEIRRWAAQAGFKHIGWTGGVSWEDTGDTMDWIADKDARGYHTAEEISGKILNYGNGKKDGASGMIVLMHLGTERNDDFPHLKLPEIIRGMREKGYEWVKISEMVEP